SCSSLWFLCCRRVRRRKSCAAGPGNGSPTTPQTPARPCERTAWLTGVEGGFLEALFGERPIDSGGARPARLRNACAACLWLSRFRPGHGVVAQAPACACRERPGNAATG